MHAAIQRVGLGCAFGRCSSNGDTQQHRAAEATTEDRGGRARSVRACPYPATKPSEASALPSSCGVGTASAVRPPAPPRPLADWPCRRRALPRAARTAKACAARCSPLAWLRRRRAAAALSRAAPAMMLPRAARLAICTRRVCSLCTPRHLPAGGRQLPPGCPRPCAPSTARPATAQAGLSHCAWPIQSWRSRAVAPQRRVTSLGPAQILSQPGPAASCGLRWPLRLLHNSAYSRVPALPHPCATAHSQLRNGFLAGTLPASLGNASTLQFLCAPLCDVAASPARPLG